MNAQQHAGNMNGNGTTQAIEAMEGTAKEAWALFLGNPDMSARAAVRKLHAKGLGMGRQSLNRIRKEVRRSLSKEPDHRPQPKKDPSKAPSTPGARRQWLDSWVLEHPGAKIHEAKAALLSHFGVGVGTEAVANAVRIAKELSSQQPKPAMEETPKNVSKEKFEDLVELARKLGVKRIEFFGEGELTVH